MTYFTIAGIQMHIGMESNIEAVRHRLDILMHLYPWVEMVMLSELAAHGPVLRSAQETGGTMEQDFCEMARHHQIWMVPGSLFEERNGKIYNMTPVIDPQGKVITRYRKMFPLSAL